MFIWGKTLSDPILNISDLWAHYGVIPAVRGVSMDVRQGELAALVGANGAGKSTLLRAVSGLVRPSAGRISFAGTEIGARNAWDIAALGIAHVPQGRRCFAALTVEENLRAGGYRQSAARTRERMDAVFAAFPVLLEKRGQRAETLSGGQQQMLAIGRALTGSPSLLMLDEPSLGLSPVMVQELANVLRKLVRDFSTAVLLVDQNSRLALKISERAYLMSMGGIVASGPSAEVAAVVQSTYLGSTGAAG